VLLERWLQTVDPTGLTRSDQFAAPLTDEDSTGKETSWDRDLSRARARLGREVRRGAALSCVQRLAEGVAHEKINNRMTPSIVDQAANLG